MKKVVVGMSGGVDSSVAAHLLKEAGYEVMGLFMKNWEEENEEGICQSTTDFEDATRVCELLDIPLYAVNFVEEYWNRVFRAFLEELKLGRQHPETKGLKIGFFGASTGAAAALKAAAVLKQKVSAVVSRGGRPDLAGGSLPEVLAPTLLIIGGNDIACIPLNEQAYAELGCEKKLEVIEGASHLFEEGSTLSQVANLATKWFTKWF